MDDQVDLAVVGKDSATIYAFFFFFLMFSSVYEQGWCAPDVSFSFCSVNHSSLETAVPALYCYSCCSLKHVFFIY